ncbi:DUF2927 domain-containing protein [Actibacterium ureilyticum]|uniref:DUF2927 domain-containing protein n=1 Tax=Actibacterium ureilyticum TaxID=1590614 RepID=UPI000BAB106F|nr:DUF2927 domain-containing protein [Actibacterium ureilyticum]
MKRIRAAIIGCLALIALGACELQDPGSGTVPPPAEPAKPEPPTPQPPSKASQSIARHFARVQADLVARGLLRTDGGGPDVPFDAKMLAEDFVRIALYDEYVTNGGVLVARETESRLRRWKDPIALGVVFGDSVPAAKRAKDKAIIASYAARLRRVSGHPIFVVPPEHANYHLLILNEDERRALGPRLQDLVPGVDDTVIRTITQMPRSTFCLVFASSEGASPNYKQAVAVIRSEHPDLLRKSCIHEELAQGMGLANDSPQARPSIFNDDEEFALLTTHDELLLKMLYDPRLRPGMTPDEARPIVQALSRQLLGGES